MRRLRLCRLAPPLAAIALTSGAVLAQTPRPVRPALHADAGRALTTAPSNSPDAGLSPSEEARRARVVARVGDQTITVGELEDMLNEAPPPVRQAYVDPDRRREFLENMIQTTLLANEARRRHIDQTPEMSSAIRRILAQRLQQVTVLEAVTPESVSDADVRTYYDAHVGDYQQPEFRRATVIYLNDRAAAETTATDARAARGDMRRIQALVRERSVDQPTREHDGDLFYFRREGGGSGANAVDPAIAAAAFGLAREMDVSPPVQLRDGRFAVVVLTGVRPALRRTLDDQGVVNSIRGFIVRERRSQREQQLLDELRARLQPEVHEDRLDLIRMPASDLGNVPPFDPADRGAPRRPPTPSGASPVPTSSPPGGHAAIPMPPPAVPADPGRAPRTR